MARTPAQSYNVHKVQDGSQIVTGVSLALARSEAARLCAEARVRVGSTIDGVPIYAGMAHGEISRYEVRTATGLVVR